MHWTKEEMSKIEKKIKNKSVKLICLLGDDTKEIWKASQ